jgi:hypothetical protein
MPFISVTRLHLRSVRFLPPFLLYTTASSRQARRASGYLGGWLSTEGMRGFWTVTVWHDEAAMRAFRNASPHRRAMGRLIDWCDEASYVHWPQEGVDPPDAAAAYQRLASSGKISKVAHPSVDHGSGRTVGDRLPRPGGALRPAGV